MLSSCLHLCFSCNIIIEETGLLILKSFPHLDLIAFLWHQLTCFSVSFTTYKLQVSSRGLIWLRFDSGWRRDEHFIRNSKFVHQGIVIHCCCSFYLQLLMIIAYFHYFHQDLQNGNILSLFLHLLARLFL